MKIVTIIAVLVLLIFVSSCASNKVIDNQQVISKSVKTFFSENTNEERGIDQKVVLKNNRVLERYSYNLQKSPLPEEVEDLNETIIGNYSGLSSIPSGNLYLKVNWFCSAALTRINFSILESNKEIGWFTGDCTNPNVIVKGNFIPMYLGKFEKNMPINFHVSTEHQWLENKEYNIFPDGPCIIDNFPNISNTDVFAVQFTCDDGLQFPRSIIVEKNGKRYRVPADINNNPISDIAISNYTLKDLNKMSRPDDIQFTLYVFPDDWNYSQNQSDFLTDSDLKSDDDGDGISYEKEISLNTNPNNWDTDSDNLGDYEEVYKYLTDPTQPDTDKDGIKDYTEVNMGSNPLGPGMATDEQLAQWKDNSTNQLGKPVISNIVAKYEGNYLIISWDVSPNADGIVNYGLTQDYGAHISNYSFTNIHSIPVYLSELNKTIHYAIRSCSPAPHPSCTSTNDFVINP